MNSTLIVVTCCVLVSATCVTPAYYVCTFRNIFKGKVLPLSEETEIQFWDAIPEYKMLLKGIIGEVACHERHWVEVRIVPTGTLSAEPWYHICFPISTIHFKLHTTLYWHCSDIPSFLKWNIFIPFPTDYTASVC